MENGVNLSGLGTAEERQYDSSVDSVCFGIGNV